MMIANKTAQLVHNPGAGDGEMSGKELTGLITAAGYKVIYTSSKEEVWELDEDADMVIVAAGDGTIKKVAWKMLADMDKARPIAILPMGTANNLSKSLNIGGDIKEVIGEWEKWNIVKFDVAGISGISKPSSFLESIGFGMFPYLLKKLEAEEPAAANKDEELRLVLKETYKAARQYKGRKCKLTIDGKHYAGRYVMVEVMNIRSMGANLQLNPTADSCDGYLEVVMVTRKRRRRLTKYVKGELKNGRASFHIVPVKGRNISIRWSGKLCHVDDELVKLSRNKRIDIAVQPGMLEFLV